MVAKALFVFCASALFLQTTSAECCGSGINAGYLNDGWGSGLGLGSGCGNSLLGYGNGLGYGNSLGYGNVVGYGNGLGNIANSAASGGAFGVSSASPIYPDGLSVRSDNAIGGPLELTGTLPFVSAVALEDRVPSVGAAGVQYSCGNGNIGIESVGSAGLGYGAGIGSGLGYGAGLGCGGINGIGTLGGIRNSCNCGGVY